MNHAEYQTDWVDSIILIHTDPDTYTKKIFEKKISRLRALQARQRRKREKARFKQKAALEQEQELDKVMARFEKKAGR